MKSTSQETEPRFNRLKFKQFLSARAALSLAIVTLLVTPLSSCDINGDGSLADLFHDTPDGVRTDPSTDKTVMVEIGTGMVVFSWELYPPEDSEHDYNIKPVTKSDNPAVIVADGVGANGISGWCYFTPVGLGRTNVHLSVAGAHLQWDVWVTPHIVEHNSAVFEMRGETLHVTAIPYRYELVDVTLNRYYGDRVGTLPEEYAGVSNVVVDEGITKISGNTFSACTNLTSVYLPSTMKDLGAGAFSNCFRLSNVEFASGYSPDFRDLAANMFAGCTSLTHISIPLAVEYIREGAFKNSGLTSIVLHENIDQIDNNAFAGCRDLKTVACLQMYPPLRLGTGNFTAEGDTLRVPADALARYRANSAWSAAFNKIEAI